MSDEFTLYAWRDFAMRWFPRGLESPGEPCLGEVTLARQAIAQCNEIDSLRAQLAAAEKDRDEARDAARHLLWMQYGDQKPVNTLERWPWLKEVEENDQVE